MAKYIMDRLNTPTAKRDGQLFPRLDITGTFETRDLIEIMCENTTFAVSEVRGFVALLAKEIAQRIGEGYAVKIDDLGIFTASLALKKGFETETADAKTKRNAQSICLRTVNFRPDKEFINEAQRNFKPERSPRKSRRSSDKYTAEERLLLAQGFLKENPYMTVANYVALTGLCRTAASLELRQFADNTDSSLTTSGRGTHKVYVRKN